MKAIDLLSLSTRMFRTRPLRTWLTILGISVGTGAVLFLVALGYGLQNIILKKIVFNEAMLSLNVTPSSDLLTLNPAVAEKFRTIPHIRDVAPLAVFEGHASWHGVYGAVEVRGADSQFFNYAGLTTSAGNIYSNTDPHPAIVSEAVLRLFNITNQQDMIGQTLTLQILRKSKKENSTLSEEATPLSPTFTVAGIIDDPQNSFVYIPLSELQSSVLVDRFDQVELKVDDSNNIAFVKDQIIAQGFQAQSLSEIVDQANKIFHIIQIVLGLFGAVALLVSSIGMFNTMTVTLLERTNEIGIMRALGASQSSLKAMFLTESVVIGFFGGIFGILLGVLEGKIVNIGINFLAVRFGGTSTDLFLYPYWFLAVIVLLSTGIGWFSGIFPARRAGAMDPLEALRYK